MNTHEEYVTLETAKLLKQAGFDWDVKTYYTPNSGNKLHEDDWYPEWYDKENIDPFMIETFPAPTQAVAMRWLREVKRYNIDVDICKNDNESICYRCWIIYVYPDNTTIFVNRIEELPTYEQAAEAGIQECLKIILSEQEQ